MELLEKLNWRYATKKMNGETVPEEKLNKILEAIRLAPSSYGLTPYKVLVVTDPRVRENLKSACWGQTQITDGSVVLVFAAKTNIDETLVEEFILEVANYRGINVESLNEYKDAIMGTLSKMDSQTRISWAQRQAYIGLGFGLVGAAVEDIDSTPMEGFKPNEVDEILGLNSQNLASTCILALGYRDESNDYLVHQPKFRFSSTDFFKQI